MVCIHIISYKIRDIFKVFLGKHDVVRETYKYVANTKNVPFGLYHRLDK